MNYEILYGERTEGATIITLEQAKMNSKIDYDYEDDLLQLYIDAINDEFESYTGAIILEREVSIHLEKWETEKFYIPAIPLQSIERVEYIDELGENQVLHSKYYHLFQFDLTKSPTMKFCKQSTLPKVSKDEDFPIIIKCKIGYSNENIPDDIRKAALLSFSSVETFREDMSVKPNRLVHSLLGNYKKY